MLYRSVLFLLAVTVAGCASRIDVATDQKSLNSARSCCSGLESLPHALPAAPSQTVKLAPESPHFDFGSGLAPFAVMKVDTAKTRVVEVISTLHTTTLEAGNMYHFRGVVPDFLFLNEAGVRVVNEAPTRSAPVLAGTSGQYSLSTSIKVPDGASRLVIATRLSAVGSKNSECIHPGGSGRPVLYTECVAFPAGTLRLDDWRGAIYGALTVIYLPLTK